MQLDLHCPGTHGLEGAQHGSDDTDAGAARLRTKLSGRTQAHKEVPRWGLWLCNSNKLLRATPAPGNHMGGVRGQMRRDCCAQVAGALLQPRWRLAAG
jgi:hypothetical protein